MFSNKTILRVKLELQKLSEGCTLRIILIFIQIASKRLAPPIPPRHLGETFWDVQALCVDGQLMGLLLSRHTSAIQDQEMHEQQARKQTHHQQYLKAN